MNLGRFDFSKWAYGLIAAFLGGGAGAFSSGIGAMIVYPQDVFGHKFWTLVGSTFMIGGLVPFFAYLHQQPLPDIKTVEKTTQITMPATQDTPKIVETVKETHTEPLTTAESPAESKGAE